MKKIIMQFGKKNYTFIIVQIKNGIKNYVNSFQKGIDDIVQEQEKDIKKIVNIDLEEENKKKKDKS